MKTLTFRLLGFPVHVQPGFFLFLGIVAILQLNASTVAGVVAWCVAVTLSFLVHELGHALAAKASGASRIRIDLAFFHGTASHSPTSVPRRLFIALAGPGAGFLLALVALLGLTALGAAGGTGSGGPLGLLEMLATDLLYLNVVYGLFNLLPCLVLDGGTALHAGVTWGWGAQTGDRVASFVGTLVSGAIAAFGVVYGQWFLLGVGAWLLQANVQVLRAAWGLR